MTMFARLKRRPIEFILLLVTFNLVGTGLVAIMAFTVIVWGLGVGPVYTN